MTGGLYTSATYGGLYSEGRFALERAGIPNAALDARVLLQYATGRTWQQLFDGEQDIASPGEITSFNEAIAKRIARVPVAQITGHKEFWSLDFKVDASTLVPRPETEHLIERALELLPPDAKGRVLDLGTGSGCLIVTLLKERPGLTGVALDLSQRVLKIARANAAQHGVADRIGFVEGDFAAAAASDERFDLVIANPPYLSAAELKDAEPEVRDHEPALALSPGTDGLEAYRAIAPLLPRLLKEGAPAVLEIGAEQGEKVRALLESAGLDSIRISPDLAGLPRVVSARKPKENNGLTVTKKGLASAR